MLVYVVDAIAKLQTAKETLFLFSMALTALTFVGIGLLKARVTKTGRFRAAFETLLLGAIAAGLAYGLGGLLESIVT
jgi:VIT1/CCC1 family predicted Fe2+/Mn2+ transporter